MVEAIFPIRLEGATLNKKGKPILRDISHTIDGNGPLIILGPNGAGKTSLLRLLFGLERCSDGNISWNLSKEKLRHQLSFVFQTPIVMRRSVIDNIAYPLTIRGTKTKDAIKIAHQWANAVGLGNSISDNANVLSGGERQKLAIARALITKPTALFLDEPTTNLDGRATREIESILADARKSGTHILMTTHDIGQARRIAKRVIFMHQGTIAEAGAAKTFFKQPETRTAQAYLTGDIVD